MNFLFELITTRFHEKLIPNFQTNLENIQKLYIFEIAKVLIRAHEPNFFIQILLCFCLLVRKMEKKKSKHLISV